MRLAALLSFTCGFASLSLEILWVRLYGFVKSSTPAAFGFVLCIYLFGIAVGAALGARACRQGGDEARLWRASLAALLLSSVLSPLLPAAYAHLASAGMQQPLLDVALVGLASTVLSFVFPIAHHLGTERSGTARGRHFARVYTANVAGAALGPLVTGYMLLDHLSLQSSFLLVGVVQAVAVIVLVRDLRLGSGGRAFVLAAGLGGAGMVAAAATLDPHAMVRPFGWQGEPAKTVVENRHGIISITPGRNGDDIVTGGNVYDGRTNVDPDHNTNGLERPLLAGVLHPAPRRVLIAGLSIGTWLAVLREFPGVEAIDVIEINPGYLQALQAYPAQADAVRDARVNLVVDDARRWLRHHPERQYDLVVMNTTMHWRANSTLLLSREMLRQLQSHMAAGAILAFNATGSGDAFATAAEVFPHAYRYGNFVYASDHDFRPEKDSARARAVYRRLQLQGRPMFSSGSENVERFLAPPFVAISADRLASARPLETITDDNMLPEFRYGRLLYLWADVFAPP